MQLKATTGAQLSDALHDFLPDDRQWETLEFELHGIPMRVWRAPLASILQELVSPQLNW
jgi:hypothetical protein